jgi:hypothetical protein
MYIHTSRREAILAHLRCILDNLNSKPDKISNLVSSGAPGTAVAVAGRLVPSSLHV